MQTIEEDEKRARQVLESFQLPDELSGIDMALGRDLEDAVSLELTFNVKADTSLNDAAITRLSRFMMSVADTILRNGVSLMPYVHLRDAA